MSIPTEPGAALETVITAVLPQLVEYLDSLQLRDARVVHFLPSSQLAKLLPSLSCTLSLPTAAATLSPPQPSFDVNALRETVSFILSHSTATAHPLFLDKLYAGTDVIGQLAELLTAILNTNTHVYATAPLFVLMERQLIHLLAMKAGYSASDGVMCPGGSYSNLMAVLVARQKHFFRVKQDGWQAQDRPVLFVSSSAHYSLVKAANAIGCGMRAVRKVPIDSSGKMKACMLAELLRDSRAKGEHPFFVCATAGTTVLAAFDPLEEIADVLDEDYQRQLLSFGPDAARRVHLHVDGSWGGSMLFSPRHTHLLAGLHRSDSFTINPHKLLGVPLQCSFLLVKGEEPLLYNTTTTHAECLFHEHADSAFDIGNRTLQCGKKNDALKFWLAWRCHGETGFQQRLGSVSEKTLCMVKALLGDRRFALLFYSPLASVCFFYLPPCIRDAFHAEVTPHLSALKHRGDLGELDGCILPELMPELTGFFPLLDRVPPLVYEAMQKDGRLLVNFSNLPEYSTGLPLFFRAILHNPYTTVEHIPIILDLIDEIGGRIEWD